MRDIPNFVQAECSICTGNTPVKMFQVRIEAGSSTDKYQTGFTCSEYDLSCSLFEKHLAAALYCYVNPQYTLEVKLRDNA